MSRCDLKSTFAFITYADERDAEDALEKVCYCSLFFFEKNKQNIFNMLFFFFASQANGKELFGSRINVEWAKGSGRTNSSSSRDDG